MSIESWKDISGWGGKYQISNLGRCRSYAWNRELILKGSIGSHGYWTVTLSRGRGNTQTYTIHTLVADAFIPNPKSLPYVCHIDGTRLNNRLENLRRDTERGNSWDRENHGTVPRGDSHPGSKVSTAQVEEIRILWQSGEYPQTSLAKRFHLTQSTISTLVNHKHRKRG